MADPNWDDIALGAVGAPDKTPPPIATPSPPPPAKPRTPSRTAPPQQKAAPQKQVPTGPSYFALRLLASIYKGLGFLCLAVAAIVLFEYLSPSTKDGEPSPLMFGSSLGLLLAGVTCLATGQAIGVFIRIEENTRRTSETIARLAESLYERNRDR